MTFLATLLLAASVASPSADRRVAVTIDDLPGPPRCVVGGNLEAFSLSRFLLLTEPCHRRTM